MTKIDQMDRMTPEEWRTLEQAALGEIPRLTVEEMAKVTHLAPSTVRQIRQAMKGKTLIQVLAEASEVIADLEREGI
jgi:predicted transcriptional regulator of viral defense system